MRDHNAPRGPRATAPHWPSRSWPATEDDSQQRRRGTEKTKVKCHARHPRKSFARVRAHSLVAPASPSPFAKDGGGGSGAKALCRRPKISPLRKQGTLNECEIDCDGDAARPRRCGACRHDGDVRPGRRGPVQDDRRQSRQWRGRQARPNRDSELYGLALCERRQGREIRIRPSITASPSASRSARARSFPAGTRAWPA